MLISIVSGAVSLAALFIYLKYDYLGGQFGSQYLATTYISLFISVLSGFIFMLTLIRIFL